MKPIHGLPDSRGSLSVSFPSRAIAEVNKGVHENVTRQAGKQGPYMKLSVAIEIANYAGQHGAAKTARHFSRKLEKHVSESMVHREVHKEGVCRGTMKGSEDRRR